MSGDRQWERINDDTRRLPVLQSGGLIGWLYEVCNYTHEGPTWDLCFVPVRQN